MWQEKFTFEKQWIQGIEKDYSGRIPILLRKFYILYKSLATRMEDNFRIGEIQFLFNDI